jgi:signal transduction histidine kinase
MSINRRALGEHGRVRGDEIEASRTRIAEAADEARRRLERDLHDGAQQRFLNVALRLEVVRGLVTGPREARAEIETASAELREAIEELRQLAHGIHPPMLAEIGLRAALSGLARRSDVPFDLRVDAELRLPRSIQAAAYFITAEALANVTKHARARRVTITAERDGEWVCLVVTDDGIGGARLGKGFGLQGMADRAQAAGGYLELESPPGGPTSVAVRLPVAPLP